LYIDAIFGMLIKVRKGKVFMKSKAMILAITAGLLLTVVYFDSGFAKAKSEAPSGKIGFVNIRSVFQNCKRNERYKVDSAAEKERLMAELSKLSKEVEAAKAGMQAYQPGSDDYMIQFKEALEKQASLEAKTKFYEQKLGSQDKVWTQKLYQDIVKITSDVAKGKDLDIVFGEDDANFENISANELMMTIRMQKVLYKKASIDITDEVLARLDAGS